MRPLFCEIPETGEPGHRESGLLIGLDVGSTTVKAVCLDPASREIVWSRYRRHETRQPEVALELLIAIEESFPQGIDSSRLFITGSGAQPLVEPTGGLFVQEVNAVTLAVEHLHPDAGSVVELGGQDAKIIIFQVDPETGRKQACCSMNDKCASGTGATIDKCMIKVGLSPEEVAALEFNPDKLHKVAAKCGVFAETDIVNLIKSGTDPREVMCSLGDAIVNQNLAVLTRGNTLRHKVILLGGPNTYLPFLRECWRMRIPETWRFRGHAWPGEVPVEDLIVVPENAEYYAAIGAILYGLEEPDPAGWYRGTAFLRDFVSRNREGQFVARSGPPLVSSRESGERFRRAYAVPAFVPAAFAPGQKVRAVIGLDGGSTSSKAVLVSGDAGVLAKAYRISEGNPIADMKQLLADLREKVTSGGAELEVLGFGVTGYAADVLGASLCADANIVETVAHMTSAVHFFGEVDVICDIGGQDIKVLFLQNGEITDFRLSNQCSAGNGMLLQAMASQFGVPMSEYADVAFEAKRSPEFSYGCAVFLDSDRVNFQKEGFSREELLAGLAMVLPKNVWQYVVQIPRMAKLGKRFVLQGGTQCNLAAVKAQVDYIRDRVPGAEVMVHPHCGEAGAIGAAMEALRVVRGRGRSTFIGLEQAIDLKFSTRSDETTRCGFCSNHCARTFVDSKTPEGRSSRYISGFSCERGTVESKEALRELVGRRQQWKKEYENLVEHESLLAFRPAFCQDPLPGPDQSVDEVSVRRTWTGGIRRKATRRDFRRSSETDAHYRKGLRIGIPRALNLYSTAPFFRAYFETLGVASRNVRFSPYTSEKLFREGARYGSVDPCYPSKVVQSHIHELLCRIDRDSRETLDYLFFPTITHVPSFLDETVDVSSCPLAAGTPNVMKAAFTREKDAFAGRGVIYVDGAVTLDEPHYLGKLMFEMWGDRLRITRDESDFALDQAWTALEQFDREMETRGREVLDQVEERQDVAILMLGRPYHLDPGINHGIFDEFQALGFPVLTIRSIPKDPAWLARWFGDEIERGLIRTANDITDVWPENHSANSAQKVWGAKFAARHPNVAVLDLSSFKCGHDAPTYGLVDEIIKASGTPYMALHDLDANKPAGSQKIRVKTFAHTLERYREKLREDAFRTRELEESLARKKRELIAARQRQLSGGSGVMTPLPLDQTGGACAGSCGHCGSGCSGGNLPIPS